MELQIQTTLDKIEAMQSEITDIDFGIDSEKGGEVCIVYKKEWFEIFTITPAVKVDIKNWIDKMSIHSGQ